AENLEQPCGKQPSIADRLEGVMIVGHNDHEAGWLAVHFGHEGKLGPHDVFQHLRLVQKALARHWEEPPILLPRGVVDLPAPIDLTVEILQVEIAKGESISTQ